MNYGRPGYDNKREWIVTNGLGGYASSTIIGENTRGYHGLLVAALSPPVRRHLLLTKIEETLNGTSLSTNKYPDAVFPEGYKHLEQFSLHPFPTFTFKVGDAVLEKTVFMIRNKNAVVIEYNLEKDGELKLAVLMNSRNFHYRTKEEKEFEIKEDESKAKVVDGNGIGMIIGSERAKFEKKENWYYDMVYEREKERGLDYTENHFSPGVFTFNGQGRFHLLCFGGFDTQLEGEFSRLFSTNHEFYDFLKKREKKRIEHILSHFNKISSASHDPHLNILVKSADDFIVERGNGKSIIAGYHWFGDWGRDTMISVNGLATALGRYAEAESIISTFAKHCRRGILPNCFDEESGEPMYNSVDGALWLFIAVHKLFKKHMSGHFIMEMLPIMRGIIDNYMKGTDFGIKMQEDFLISCGSQLTWMDAKIGTREITPRNGKPIEINALWYNALRIYGRFIGETGNMREAEEIERIAIKVKESFAKYWNEKTQYVYDVLDPLDESIRPNALFALSLPFPLFEKERALKILNKIQAELYTPMGIRTLPNYDWRYRGKYGGGIVERDEAYHQGTVWNWLLGHYIIALARFKADSFEEIKKLYEPIFNHLNGEGLGHISEIFDGDGNAPKGCVAQAWSTAEMIASYVEAWEIMNGKSNSQIP